MKEKRNSGKKWTEEQSSAIHTRSGNLLVSAAAGAGKTAVLVERIICRITDMESPTDVDRMLVLTFTNAAAAEMRERVGQALAARINANADSRHLNRQMALLSHASIGTIHSFCLEVIRQHFYNIGLDPGFRVADDTEADLLRMETMEELFERRYSGSEHRYFHQLVDCYGGKRDDAALQKLVMDIYYLARSTPQPKAWLDNLTVGFDLADDVNFDALPLCDALKQAIHLELSGIVDALDLAVRLAGKPEGPGVYLDTLEADHEVLLRLTQAITQPDVSWDNFAAMANAVVFGKLKPVRNKDVDQDIKKQITDLREQVKKQFKELLNNYFSRPAESFCADLLAMAPLVKEFRTLVHDFDEAYQRAKSDNGVVDFTDLEHYCLQVLSEDKAGGTIPSAAARELRQRFVEVLVDEYQDINPVQEAILKLVSRQEDAEQLPNLFMVGDVKQSIYRFRLADPGLFLIKYIKYLPKIGAVERRIDLTKNFRSRRGVVAAVNYVFRQLMTPAVGELTYDENAELVCGADYPIQEEVPVSDAEVVELHLCVPEQLEDYDKGEVFERGEPEELDATQREARLIAARIEELVDHNSGKNAGWQIYDHEQKLYRSLDYRDIVVLMRATVGYANIYLEEFRRLGVPAYAELATGYFQAVEVETVLSLLKVIDNPRQDIPLTGVLRSPIVGLEAEELALIRLYRKQGCFFDAVVVAADLADSAIARKIIGFLQQLDNWRTIARQEELAGLIWTLYRDTGYYNFVGGLPGGGQRQANLRALHQRAQQYERTGFRGLFLFLRFIERMQEGSRDLGTARVLYEKDNVVRLMSVHKSKGLEFPVVFVAGLGRKFNLKDLNKTVLLHKDLGVGPQFVDLKKRLTYPTAAKLAIKHRLKIEALAEELRVLYVAMTRAKEKLILVGSATQLKTKISRWCASVANAGEVLSDSEIAGAKTYLDWLMPVIARHRDGVKIREQAQCNSDPPPTVALDTSRWAVYFNEHFGEELESCIPEEDFWSHVRELTPLNQRGDYDGIVTDRLSWQYPYEYITAYGAKTSVSELKHQFFHQIEDTMTDYQPSFNQRPRFMQGLRGLTAAESGAALHLVMQNLDLSRVADANAINIQIGDMIRQELLTQEQAAAVQVEGILNFWQSALGRRVLAGKEILREIPFTLALPAGEVYAEIARKSGEVVIVQGIIDCLVDEGDCLLLLDYKTDHITHDRIESSVARYRHQLDLYGRAVESIYKKEVKDRYLYLFSLGLEIKL